MRDHSDIDDSLTICLPKIFNRDPDMLRNPTLGLFETGMLALLAMVLSDGVLKLQSII